tara:strand:+ start:2230 stop:3102 length:873 start_codon:yes stop_codon:yes gene_type:complete
MPNRKGNKMENILETREADRPGVENASLQTTQPSVSMGETPTENPVGTGEPITEQQPNETSPRDDSTRFEYWQSQADKAKGELSAIRNELEYYKTNAVPQNVDQQGLPSNGQTQGHPQGLQEPSLKEPTAPERPHSYNEVDAYNDPQSESFKYRIAKESYRDQYLDFLTKKDQVRDQEMQQQYQQQMQQQQTQMVQQQAMSHAVNNFGWENQKAAEFVRWSQNPENLTLDNLAKLFELRTNPNPVVKQRTEEMQNQAGRLAVPKTAAVQTGQSEQPRSDEQLFSDALLGR